MLAGRVWTRPSGEALAISWTSWTCVDGERPAAGGRQHRIAFLEHALFIIHQEEGRIPNSSCCAFACCRNLFHCIILPTHPPTPPHLIRSFVNADTTQPNQGAYMYTYPIHAFSHSRKAFVDCLMTASTFPSHLHLHPHLSHSHLISSHSWFLCIISSHIVYRKAEGGRRNRYSNVVVSYLLSVLVSRRTRLFVATLTHTQSSWL